MGLRFWDAGMRDLAGLTVILVLVTGGGSGVFEAGSALAGVSARRVDMMATGVDMMPVGTAKQVDRAKRARRLMP